MVLFVKLPRNIRLHPGMYPSVGAEGHINEFPIPRVSVYIVPTPAIWDRSDPRLFLTEMDEEVPSDHRVSRFCARTDRYT